MRQVAYSLFPGADMWAEDVSLQSEGMSFVAVGKNFRQPISSTLVGDYKHLEYFSGLFQRLSLGLQLPRNGGAVALRLCQGCPGAWNVSTW